jgi:hypothetical protein
MLYIFDPRNGSELEFPENGQFNIPVQPSDTILQAL